MSLTPRFSLLVSMLWLLFAVPAAAQLTHDGGGDYGGANVDVSGVETDFGTHTNIGTLRILSGAELHVTPFNGTVGSSTGTLILQAQKIEVYGAIIADGAGGQGGAVAGGGNGGGGSDGRGTGSSTDGRGRGGTAGADAGGGGGGAYGGIAGNGGTGSAAGGEGGKNYNPTTGTVERGSGGGGGGGNATNGAPGGFGGAAGGRIELQAQNPTLDGTDDLILGPGATLQSRGMTSPTVPGPGGGGGGGGSGGGILLAAPRILLQGRLDANGGPGQNAAGTGEGGGGGSGGHIKVLYAVLTNLGAVTTADGGAAGNGTGGASTAGAAGVVALTETNMRPWKPTATIPAHGSFRGSSTVILGSSAFDDPDDGPGVTSTHAASQWQVRRSSGSYSSPAYDSGSSATGLTSITTSALTDGEYYWHVRHKDNSSGVDSDTARSVFSAYSDEIGFVIDTTAPSAPALTSPAANAEVQTPAALVWTVATDNRSGVEAYEVQVSKSEAFSGLEYAVTVAAVTANTTALETGTHFWRVRSRDRAGNSSAFSPTGTFKAAGQSGTVTPTIAAEGTIAPEPAPNGPPGGAVSSGGGGGGGGCFAFTISIPSPRTVWLLTLFLVGLYAVAWAWSRLCR